MFGHDSDFRPGWGAGSAGFGGADSACVVCRSGGGILAREEGGGVWFAGGSPGAEAAPGVTGGSPAEAAPGVTGGSVAPPSWPVYTIGVVGRTRINMCAAPADAQAPPGFTWIKPRDTLAAMSVGFSNAMIRASMLASWEWENRYCGRCGAGTVVSRQEPCRVCPACSLRLYPRVAPAIITLIESVDTDRAGRRKILLVHNRSFTPGLYSCVAGFVDAGECLEEALVREIQEETGLKAVDIHYAGSQAWPGPYSLMCGFWARAGGDPVPDGEEITDAQWYSVDQLPVLPPAGTLSRFMIDAWIEKTGKK